MMMTGKMTVFRTEGHMQDGDIVVEPHPGLVRLRLSVASSSLVGQRVVIPGVATWRCVPGDVEKVGGVQVHYPPKWVREE